MKQLLVQNEEVSEQNGSESGAGTFLDRSGTVRSGFNRFAPILVCAYGVVAALSIAASQIIVVSLSLWWLIARDKSRQTPNSEKTLVTALCFFIVCSLISGFLGVNPSRALLDSLKLGFALIFPFVVAETLSPQITPLNKLKDRVLHYVFALCSGQLMAAFHSIGSAYNGSELPIGIPGAVTESGQLVLILPLLIALSLQAYKSQMQDAERSYKPWSFWLSSICLIALGVVVAWPELLSASLASYMSTFSLVLLALILVYSFSRCLYLKQSPVQQFYALQPVFIGLLLAAMIVNLKRGPWLGLLAALFILGAVYSRRLIVYSISIAVLIFSFVPPAKERLLAFASHFSIAGGRQSMWEIGLELIQRYPLGIGLDNSRFMRVLDPSLPESHRHMHNNLLNIAVETGFIGLACYLPQCASVKDYCNWPGNGTSGLAGVGISGIQLWRWRNQAYRINLYWNSVGNFATTR